MSEANDLEYRRSQALQFFGEGEAVDAINKLIAEAAEEDEDTDD